MVLSQNRVVVHIIKARDLPSDLVNVEGNTSITVEVGNHQGRTRCIPKNPNPVWNERFIFPYFSKDEIHIRCAHSVNSPDYLVINRIEIEKLDLSFQPFSGWLPLYNSKNIQNGELLVEVERFYGQSLDQRPSYLQYLVEAALTTTQKSATFHTDVFALHKVSIKVVRLRGLSPVIRSDLCYVEIQVLGRGDTVKTSEVAERNPVWDQNFELSAGRDDVLVFNYYIKRNLVSTCKMRLDSLKLNETPFDGWIAFFGETQLDFQAVPIAEVKVIIEGQYEKLPELITEQHPIIEQPSVEKLLDEVLHPKETEDPKPVTSIVHVGHKFRIIVRGAEDLISSNSYVEIRVGKLSKRTSSRYNTRIPVWDETLQFVITEGEFLEVQVKDSDLTHEIMARALFPGSAVLSFLGTDCWISLHDPAGNPAGKLLLTLKEGHEHDTTSIPLTLRLIGAKSLLYDSSYFAQVWLGDVQYRTTTAESTCNPTWGNEFHFQVFRDQSDIMVEIYMTTTRGDSLLGEARLSVIDLFHLARIAKVKEFPILNNKGVSVGNLIASAANR